MTYETAFTKNVSGYYVLHGETLTLKCRCSSEIYEILWLAGDRIIYRASRHSSEMVTKDVNERIQNHEYDGDSQKITITVNKTEDEKIIFKCRVATRTGISESSENLNSILGEFSINPSKNLC